MAKKAKKTTKSKLKTRIAILLDRSSSMGSIRNEAVAAFNQQLKSIKESAKKVDTTVSLYTFATEADAPTFSNVKSKDLKDLELSAYNPDGMTAMFDSMGKALEDFKALKEFNDENTSFLVVVISDGQENNSKKFNAHSIAEQIKALQDTKRWTFTYLGANQDLSKVSATLNIPINNTYAFAASSAGATTMSTVNATATANYLSLRSKGIGATMDAFVDKVKK